MTRARALLLAALLSIAGIFPAAAQTAPGWTFGYVPTVAQWNAAFAGKQDVLAAPPLLTTGGQMVGPLVTAASSASRAGLNLIPGTAPSSPNDGDLWTTSSSIFARINGATVDLVNGACPTCAVTNATNTFAQFQVVNQNATAAPTPQGGILLQLNQANATVGRIEVDTYAATTIISGIRANNTALSPTALALDDQILSLNAWGYDGSTRSGPAAAMRLFAGAAWTTTNHATYLDFATTSAADAAKTLTSRMRVENDGGVTLNGASSSGAGTINSTSTVNSELAWIFRNNSTGTGALTYFAVANSANIVFFGIGGTGYTSISAIQNKAVILSSSGTSGIALYANGVQPIDFYINGSRVGGFTSGGLLTLTTALAVGQGGTGCSAASGTCLDNVAGFASTGYIQRTGAGTYTFSASVPASSVTVGTTTVASGTSNGVLFNNAAVLGNTAAGTSGQLLLGVTSGAPQWGTMSGDATISNAGVVAIGATRVTSAMLNADVFSTAHSWSGGQSFTAPNLGTPASGNGVNLTGLVYTALPALAANQVLGALTATTPSGQTVPNCTLATCALQYTSGTGFGINNAITAAAVPASGITGTTLASNVVSSSLTSLGTLTSLTMGGTLAMGSNGITSTGTITSGANTITSTSALALVVGPNGTTNPGLTVDDSAGSAAAGVKITMGGAGNGAGLSVTSSAADEALGFNAKGAGGILLGVTSTGPITLTRATTISAALTYGGVTLSNSVTGTGSMVLGTGPTIAGPSLSGTVVGTYTLGGTPTINAFTAGGAIAMGANSITGIGTLAASGAMTFQSNGSTFAGNVSTGQQWIIGTTAITPATGAQLTVSRNTGTPPSGGVSSGGVLDVVQVDGSAGRINIRSFGAGSSVIYYSAGGTAAAPTQTTNGTFLGVNFGWGYSAATSAYLNAAGSGFAMVATETGGYDATHGGAELQIYTTPNATINQVKSAVFLNSGALAIGGTTDALVGGLYLNGQALIPNMTSDTATADSTVCTATTGGKLLKGTGTLGICLGTSGAQFKTAFAPMVGGLDEVSRLNLQNYRYRSGAGDGGARMQYGLTAQDVEAVIPDLVRHDDAGTAINYDSGALLFIGLRAIQQLKADNDNLRDILKRKANQ